MNATDRTARDTIATALYRMANPGSRITSPFKLVVNTGSRKQRGCVLCGATCPGYSAGYSRTMRSRAWEYEHDCSAAYLATYGCVGETLATAIRLAREALTDADVDAVLKDLVRAVAS